MQNGYQRSKVQKSYDYFDQPDIGDELLDNIMRKDAKIKMLEKQNMGYGQDFERSREITNGKRGDFESVKCSLANTNITETFNKLFHNKWVNLLMWLQQTFRKSQEIELIHIITDLLKEGYRECLLLADGQIREFTMLDKAQCIPDYEKHPELYSIRKQYAQSETARLKVRQVVSEKLLHAARIYDSCTDENRENTQQPLKEFLIKYVDCCWLMVVSTPPFTLNFDVVGQPYCKEHFRMFSPEKPVEDEKKEEGTVYEVVWPSVSLKDGSAFYEKGDVIIVSKGAAKVERMNLKACCCLKIPNETDEVESFGRTNKETIKGIKNTVPGHTKMKNTGRDKPVKQSYV